ncbi:Hint domain-containing protein [Acetobacter nitrogenifigens]|nr:Hint domain-containing protein [Acetobacter nitrogenifigens]
MATSSATVSSSTVVNAYTAYYTSGLSTVFTPWSGQTITGTAASAGNGGTATIAIAEVHALAVATSDTAGLLGVIQVDPLGSGSALSATSGGVILDSGGIVAGASIHASAAMMVFGGGTATNVNVASGANLYVGNVGSITNVSTINGYLTSKGVNVTGAGLVSGATISAGAVESLGSGGTDRASLIHGTQYVSSGAVTISDTVNSGGVQNLLSGAITTSTTVGSGGTTIASSGATVSATTVSGGSVLVLNGGKVIGGSVQNGGELVVSSGATASNVTVSSGGTEIVQSGGTVSGGTILGGGKEIVSSGASSVNVTIASGGSLVVASGSVLTGTIVSSGAVIDVDTLTYTSGGTVKLSGNTLTITEGGSSWSTVLSGTYKTADYFIIGQDTDGSTTLTFVCFCAGTLIRTEDGDRLVEDLEIGDTVLTYVDGKEVSSQLTWVGRRTMSVRTDLPVDMAGYPVRILKNALGPNVPHQDLLITPEHCLYLDGVFVPARMLVNGRSIFYDVSMTHYDYYHVETERHSILWSNGALSESYLDTGNRKEFGQQGRVVRFVNRPGLEWPSDAAAPLGVTRDVVEPIYRELEARAIELQLLLQTEPFALTDDPDLHLVTPTGHRLNAIRKANDGQVFFMVPSGVNEVRVVSRASRPSDIVGPYLDDRRHLGVLIGQISLWSGKKEIAITAHLEQEDLAGWCAREGSEMRWTTGDAWLKLPASPNVAASLLAFTVQRAGPYVMNETSRLVLAS